MGDELKTAKPPSFDVTVLGTGEIACVDESKDSVVADTLCPANAITRERTDPAGEGDALVPRPRRASGR
jgi:hypothetical protein